VAMRQAHAQAFAFGAAAMAAGHVGRGPCFVDEDETFGFQIDLAVEPIVPLLQDIGPVLLAGMASLFFRVMPRRAKKR
jgi:dTDP-4-amino-4,6-dideoxygalactose transaminase